MDYQSEIQASLRNEARTGNRVAGMSDMDRAELARNLAEYSSTTAPKESPRSDKKKSYRPGSVVRPNGSTTGEQAEAARVAADLQRTERRIETRVSGSTVGRGTRLASRAGRLERKLRRLS